MEQIHMKGIPDRPPLTYGFDNLTPKNRFFYLIHMLQADDPEFLLQLCSYNVRDHIRTIK